MVQLPQLLQAVGKGTSLGNCITSLEDVRMAVTGGGAGYLNGRFYLVGGQKFSGRYNPHGPDHGPGFAQEYTNEIRSFALEDGAGGTPVISNYRAQRDEEHLHRRDYNLVPQVFPDGKPGFTMFAGVFQYKADIPWLYPVDIREDGYQPVPAFEQQYSHYHSAHLPVYSRQSREMHTLFFGGIAQYYRHNNETKEDKEVPFVKTISQVTRAANGTLTEWALPVELPDLSGASAWLALHENMPRLPGDLLDWDALPPGEHLVGYIVGGIRSSAPNIFWPNTGKQSSASATVMAVYLRK